MSTIPVSLTEKAFNEHVLPYLSVAKRGYISKIPLYKIYNYILYRLHTGCQWYQLPIALLGDGSDKKEISYHAVYYHFRKYPKGRVIKIWENSRKTEALFFVFCSASGAYPKSQLHDLEKIEETFRDAKY